MRRLALALLAVAGVLLVGCGAPVNQRHLPYGAENLGRTRGLERVPVSEGRIRSPGPRLAGLSNVTVNETPTGPPALSGQTWHAVFADGFGAKIGTGAGEDNFWYPNESVCCGATTNKHAERGNDLNAFNASQVKVSPEGLEETAEYSPSALPAGTEEGTTFPVRNYKSGAVETDNNYVNWGGTGKMHAFMWEGGGPATYVFECYCKLASNAGSAGYENSGNDEAWWGSSHGWLSELDMWEHWGWGNCKAASTCVLGDVWKWTTGTGTHPEWAKYYTDSFLSGGFHRYTTVLKPAEQFEQYVDGVQVCGGLAWNNGLEACHSATATGGGKTKISLTFDYSITCHEGEGAACVNTTYWTTGTRILTARSLQVWVNSGDCSGSSCTGIEGGGVAPGTVLGSEGGGTGASGPVVGTSLHVSNGTWRNSPTSFTYQWKRCNEAGASCVNITAATTSNYTVAKADEAHTLRASVTAHNAAGEATQESEPTGVIP